MLFCFLLGTKDQICVAKSLIDEVIEKCQAVQQQIESSLVKREPRLPPKSGDSPKLLGSPKVERMSPIPGNYIFICIKYIYFKLLIHANFGWFIWDITIKFVLSI